MWNGRRRSGAWSARALVAACLLAPAPAARAWEAWDGRIQVHGYSEVQLRSLARNFKTDQWYLSQWANVLDIEIEADLAPDGIGPFDLVSAFARVEARFDAIYSGWGVFPTYFGDDAVDAPHNQTNAVTNAYSGIVPAKEVRRLTPENELVDFFVVPPFDQLRALGASGLDSTFAPINDALFATKKIDASLGTGIFVLGPWNFDANIEPIGSLESVPSPTLGLPLRPQVPDAPGRGDLDPHGLFVASQKLRDRNDRFGDFEQNFSQQEMAWNHGQSQDEGELRELYVDLEMLEGRLWVRAGKQSIVWGKTELFRTTDQFNPQDLALSSLPSLEESRIPLWSLRAVYSLYDVGPLEDVRLEFAMNLDDFEPVDLGRCGEPYTVWLVCGKTFGLWAHGFSAVGIAGEEHPPDAFDSWRSFEYGARIEWRYGRFSFQLSDFYGYEDFPTIDYFSQYTRKVDPYSGKPLGVDGKPLLAGDSDFDVLTRHPENRQLFDVICSATLGIAGGIISDLADNCLVDLPNSQADLGFGITPALAIGRVLGGSNGRGLTGQSVIRTITTLAGAPVDVELVELNHDPNDGPAASPLDMDAYMTDQQEALFGCGPFYGTDCDVEGIDLFNAEASVLLQAFPQFEPGGPVGTRAVGGTAVVLPGARGPRQRGYSPLIDGCVDTQPGDCAGAHALIDPRTGKLFRNELAAASYNFMLLLASLGAASGTDPDCDVNNPITCGFVLGVFDIAGTTRPEVRAGGNGEFGRRDFLWAAGSEIAIQYEARNVLGFAFDFAEDRTKTNWSFEATWMHDQPWAVTDELRGFDKFDTFNLTFSVDRPTFINFLNPGRTFFVNSQWFLRYISGYHGGNTVAHGPFSALGTLTVITGYHQDRLLPALTWVHDIRSTSGAVVGQLTYRFSTDFSATVGIAGFYGSPERLEIPVAQALPSNNGGTYESRLRYDGLSPIAERDEVFMLLRYTF